MSTRPGLRERKKAATRTAIAQAAAALTNEIGLDKVTIDAIAEAADVSVRTFHNYFTSKEAAVEHAVRSSFDDMVSALATRPAEEGVWDALLAVTLEMFEAVPGGIDGVTAMIRTVESTPAMMARYTLARMEDKQRLAQVVARRTGTDAVTDVYPMLVVAASEAAVEAAVALADKGSGRDFEELLREAFERLRPALNQPGADS
ncbi:TetR/AcrR family transcriptional regulator [Nocardia amamiensis]|uniref:TetR/AcrR family transcriptional regulator n=1 Tax=Nocardia amamiensis TaxID=404578 RepID=UPI00082E118B|nr:TetR/AcrR family transcriptional regulator [Nocardia amamiensis]